MIQPKIRPADGAQSMGFVYEKKSILQVDLSMVAPEGKPQPVLAEGAADFKADVPYPSLTGVTYIVETLGPKRGLGDPCAGGETPTASSFVAEEKA